MIIGPTHAFCRVRFIGLIPRAFMYVEVSGMSQKYLLQREYKQPLLSQQWWQSLTSSQHAVQSWSCSVTRGESSGVTQSESKIVKQSYIFSPISLKSTDKVNFKQVLGRNIIFIFIQPLPRTILSRSLTILKYRIFTQ